jgi:hypothetical protein
MRQFALIAFMMLVLPIWAQVQRPLQPAPKGFDTRRDGVKQGKVDTVEYESKAVGSP